MLIVCFINGTGECEDDVECRDELHLEYDIFPSVGDFIRHDDVAYTVANRFIISHSAEGRMRAARVQYTLELDREEEEIRVPNITNIQAEHNIRFPGRVDLVCDVDGEPFKTYVGKLELFRAGINPHDLGLFRIDADLADLILEKWYEEKNQ